MLKKTFKANFVSSLYELGSVVDKSSNLGTNRAQLVGTRDGRVVVPTYDWVSFLEPLTLRALLIMRPWFPSIVTGII